jgi:RND family efflux transporter MFP subunit
MRTFIQLLIVVALLGGSAYYANWKIENRPVAEAVESPVVLPILEVVTARVAPFQLTVRGQGEVGAREVTALVSEVSGRVLRISPALVSGGSFRAGDVLVELDPVDLEVGRARSAALLEQARTALQREEAEAAVARRQFEALGSGEGSDLALRKPQVDEAKARVAAAEADLARSLRDLQRTSLRAPFDGRVRQESAGLGQLVSRGQVLAELFSTDRAEVRVPVPDEDLGDLQLATIGVVDDGPGAWLTANFAGEERRWRGRVLRVEGELDRTSRMPTLIVGVDDPYGAASEQAGAPLMPGLFVDVTIEGRHEPAGVLLPRAALRASSKIFVVDDQDRLRYRTVTVAWRDRDHVLVTEGLDDGERVCVSPLAAPVDGMRVDVLSGPPVDSSGGGQ